MNWLIVGAGDITNKRVAPAIDAEPTSKITAVCDTAAERAQQLGDKYSAKAYTNLDEALNDSDIEAVYIATPVNLHVPHAVKALAHDKNVLVEKPLALSYAQAQELVEAEKKSKGKCGVAYFRRLSPRYEMAEEMIRTGEFGQIVLMRITFFSWFNPEPADPKYWRVVPEKSAGGALSDMGTHMFDVMIGLFGLPERVFARLETLTHPYKVEDSATIMMKYTDGPQVIASFNWNSKTWSHEFEIVGTEAKVKWHPYDGPNILKTVGRDIKDVPLPNHDNVHYPLIADFVSSIDQGKEPKVTAAEAAKTNLLLEAILLSSQQGKEILLKDI